MTDDRTPKASDDNPEWSEADIRKGARLSDFAPVLAANIRRDITERQTDTRPRQRRFRFFWNKRKGT